MPQKARRQQHGTWGAVWLMLAFGAVSLLAIVTMAPPQEAPERLSHVASAPLLSNDGGSALFNVSAMTPDQQVTNCIAVTYGGAAGASEVRFAVGGFVDAAVPDGESLADHLHIAVELGDADTAGDFGDCAGFSGAEIYPGTMTVTELNSALGEPTGWVPGPDESRVFRITMTFDPTPDVEDNLLQGAALDQTTLVWGIETAPTPSPSTSSSAAPTSAAPSAAPSSAAPSSAAPTSAAPSSAAPTITAPTTVAPTTTAPTTVAPTTRPPTTTPATTEPAPSPAGPSSAPLAPTTGAPEVTVGPTERADSSPTASTSASGAAPSGSASPTAPGPAPVTGDGGSDGDGGSKSAIGRAGDAVRSASKDVAAWFGRAGASVGQLLGDMEDVLPVGGSAAGFSMIPLGAMLLFLLTQDRLDRRDPKLSLAPVSREPFLNFVNPGLDSAERSDEAVDRRGRAIGRGGAE
ncbi:hypothetical protein [Pilimelia columellifera]|uniref:Uncharacterized protein n=1 Tax=Pilimelia columellifera subsp. columellifera TaxID=706583 RepID=A0ABP6ASK2_9ACTN